MIQAARKAGMGDIAPLLRLINDYAAKGIMLPRTEFEVSENIRDFSVIYSGADLIACGALHFYTPIMAEVRSLAVDPKWKSHGVGRQMVNALVAEANLFSLDAESEDSDSTIILLLDDSCFDELVQVSCGGCVALAGFAGDIG